MQTPEEKTMMSRIDMQASFEKSAKIQLDRNSHISLQNTNVAQKAKKYLNSNKKEAEKLHIDVRGASDQQSQRLQKRIVVLETLRYKLRNECSGSSNDNKARRAMIDELRLSQGQLDGVFDQMKSEIDQTQKQLKDLFDKANTTFEDRAKTLRSIKTHRQQEIDELKVHDDSICKYNDMIQEGAERAKENERKTHLAMLKERKERREAKMRANNTHSSSSSSSSSGGGGGGGNSASAASSLESTQSGSSFTRGKLSDEQERNIRKSIANLEVTLAPKDDSNQTTAVAMRALATLHTLRHARRDLGLSSRQALQHSERVVSTLINSEDMDDILHDQSTVGKIIRAWKGAFFFFCFFFFFFFFLLTCQLVEFHAYMYRVSP